MDIGEALKEAGMKQTLQVEGETWKQRVANLVATFKTGDEFTVDTLQCRGVGEPHHGACWGALMNALATKHVIEPTGKYVRSTRPACHAAVIQVWRKRGSVVG